MLPCMLSMKQCKSLHQKHVCGFVNGVKANESVNIDNAQVAQRSVESMAGEHIQEYCSNEQCQSWLKQTISII